MASGPQPSGVVGLAAVPDATAPAALADAVGSGAKSTKHLAWPGPTGEHAGWYPLAEPAAGVAEFTVGAAAWFAVGPAAVTRASRTGTAGARWAAAATSRSVAYARVIVSVSAPPAASVAATRRDT